MAQRHRHDQPGGRYHVMNRGISKRTIAENARDAECFFDLLGEAVQSGLILVHAAVLLTTHFHLAIESVVGRYWEALRSVQNGHSRAFNRARRRDGPLFRGRFLSKHITTTEYWVNTIRYIDHNPVSAGMVDAPQDHAFGSATHYLRATEAPWLDKRAVRSFVLDRTGDADLRPDAYRAVFGTLASSERLLERRLLAGDDRGDPLCRLLPASPSRTLDWMTWKAELADGTAPGIPVCAAETVEALLRVAAHANPDERVRLRRDHVSVWPLLRTGLLRSACGLTYPELAGRTGRGVSSIHRRVRTHGELVRMNPDYAARAAALVTGALEIDWKV